MPHTSGIALNICSSDSKPPADAPTPTTIMSSLVNAIPLTIRYLSEPYPQAPLRAAPFLPLPTVCLNILRFRTIEDYVNATFFCPTSNLVVYFPVFRNSNKNVEPATSKFPTILARRISCLGLGQPASLGLSLIHISEPTRPY